MDDLKYFLSKLTISNIRWYFRRRRHLKDGRCTLVDGYTNLVFYIEDNGTCILNPFKRCK